MNERVPMTKDGYEKRKAELDHMQGHDMIEITKRVATARELGDLSENAEYHAAREDQGMLQARIDKWRDELSRAQIIDVASLPKDVVVFGSRVKILDMQYKEEEEYIIVGPGQDDPDENRILTTSPIGQGILGKKVGEVAEIDAPRGVMKFKILKISSEPMD